MLQVTAEAGGGGRTGVDYGAAPASLSSAAVSALQWRRGSDGYGAAVGAERGDWV